MADSSKTSVHLKPGTILSGSLFSELVQAITTILMGESIKLYGKGLSTGQIKELKIRGLIKRALIITLANLSFQWQRDLQASE